MLIPILYSEGNYVIKGVKAKDSVVEVSLKFKSGPRLEIADSLYFLEVNKKKAGDVTKAKIVYES